MPQVVVLSIGIDPVLLPLRTEILRGAGYTVEEQSNPARALRVFAQGDFDLVILCHSIPAEERQRIARKIKAQKPSTLVLVVRADGEATGGIADGSVHSLDGADGLLQCMGELLSRAKPN